MRVAITGATGFVGTKLLQALVQKGHFVRVFTRDVDSAKKRVPSGVDVRDVSELGTGGLSDVEGVVNLAGEPVASKRWTDAQKARIRDSRVQMTRKVVDAMEAADRRPAVLVNASAVGYYGPHGDEEVDESVGAGRDFLASVSADWEREAERASPLGVRVVRLRIGIVLGRGEGALSQMMLPFKFFAGGKIGDGRQFVPWVHVDDVVGLMVWALTHEEVQGAVNATAPAPLRSAEFAEVLGRVMKRPAWLPVPGFALRIAVGEMAEVLVTGQRAVPKAALAKGYAFKFSEAETALRDVLGESV